MTIKKESPTVSDQLEEVDEFVGVFSGGEVDKVSWDPVAQTRTGLHRHLAGGVAEGWAFLHTHTSEEFIFSSVQHK